MGNDFVKKALLISGSALFFLLSHLAIAPHFKFNGS